jgi:hypothetical protein
MGQGIGVFLSRRAIIFVLLNRTIKEVVLQSRRARRVILAGCGIVLILNIT